MVAKLREMRKETQGNVGEKKVTFLHSTHPIFNEQDNKVKVNVINYYAEYSKTDG